MLGVDAVHVHPGGDAGEGHDEAVPPSVEGQMAQRPRIARWHRRVVQPVGEDPLGRALEDV